MVDLHALPFCLNEEQYDWVIKTFEPMGVEEKIGQLFILLKATPGVDEAQLKTLVNESHIGGFRWQNESAADAYRQNTMLQKISKIPVLIVAPQRLQKSFPVRAKSTLTLNGWGALAFFLTAPFKAGSFSRM